MAVGAHDLNRHQQILTEKYLHHYHLDDGYNGHQNFAVTKASFTVLA